MPVILLIFKTMNVLQPPSFSLVPQIEILLVKSRNQFGIEQERKNTHQNNIIYCLNITYFLLLLNATCGKLSKQNLVRIIYKLLWVCMLMMIQWWWVIMMKLLGRTVCMPICMWNLRISKIESLRFCCFSFFHFTPPWENVSINNKSNILNNCY